METQPVPKLQSLCRCTAAGSGCNGNRARAGHLSGTCARLPGRPLIHLILRRALRQRGNGVFGYSRGRHAGRVTQQFPRKEWPAAFANHMTRHIARETRQQLLSGFAGGIGAKAAWRRRFPRSAMQASNNGAAKPPRTPRTMSKPGVHLLRNRPEVAIRGRNKAAGADTTREV